MVLIGIGIIPALSQANVIKNFRDLPFSYEAVTGVSSKYPEIAQSYNNMYTKFPKYGQLSELSTVFIVSNMAYSSTFCVRMIENDSKLPSDKRWAHYNIDFGGTLSGMSETVKASVIEEYADLFWQRMPDENERAILAQGFQDLASTFPNENKSVKPVLLGVCQMFSNSIAFLLK